MPSNIYIARFLSQYPGSNHRFFNISASRLLQDLNCYSISFYAQTVDYPGGIGDPGVAGQTATGVWTGTDILAVATTTYYYQGFSAACACIPLDINGPDYDTFITELSAHELGHTMGLADNLANVTFGNSVMNPEGGTNDYLGSLSIAPTTCDNIPLPIH